MVEKDGTVQTTNDFIAFASEIGSLPCQQLTKAVIIVKRRFVLTTTHTAHLVSIITKNVNNNKIVNMIEPSDQKQKEKSIVTMMTRLESLNNCWQQWRNSFSSGFWVGYTICCFSNIA